MTCSTDQRDCVYNQVATQGPSEQKLKGYLLLDAWKQRAAHTSQPHSIIQVDKGTQVP